MEVSRSIAHREECHREGDDNRHEEKLIPLAGGLTGYLCPGHFICFCYFCCGALGTRGPH